MTTIIVKCLGCTNDVYAVNCRYLCQHCGFQGGWAEVASQDGPIKGRENEEKEYKQANKQGHDSRDKLLRTEANVTNNSSVKHVESTGSLHYVQKAEQEVWEIYKRKG